MAKARRDAATDEHPFVHVMRTLAESNKKAFGQQLRTSRQVAKKSQAQLADEVGVSPQAVSQWERGETKPELEHFHLIAHSLGLLVARQASGAPIVDSFDPATPDQETPRIQVVGYVGAGGQAFYFPAGDLDEVPPPVGATTSTVAVEVRGESLGSLFDRWLVFYDEVRNPVTPDLIGKLCVVWLANEQVFVKKVRRGSVPKLYDLVSEKEDPIKNVHIESAAKVISMAPR